MDSKDKQPGVKAEFQAVLAESAKRYKDTSGQNISDFINPTLCSIDELKRQLDAHNDGFSAFRKKRESLFGTLSAMLKPVEMVGEIVSGAASDAFPAASSIFSAVMFLVNAADDVSSKYDSIVELFEQLKVRRLIWIKSLYTSSFEIC